MNKDILINGHTFQYSYIVTDVSYSVIDDAIYVCKVCKHKFISGKTPSLSYFILPNGWSCWPQNIPSCDELVIKDIIE